MSAQYLLLGSYVPRVLNNQHFKYFLRMNNPYWKKNFKIKLIMWTTLKKNQIHLMAVTIVSQKKTEDEDSSSKNENVALIQIMNDGFTL